MTSVVRYINIWRIAIIGLLLSSSVFAQENIRIVTLKESSPYVMYDDQGEASGMLVDMWRKWGDQQGYTVSFHPMDLETGLAAVESEAFDIHIGVFLQKALPIKLQKAKPYYGLAVALYHRNNMPPDAQNNKVAMRPELFYSLEGLRFLPDIPVEFSTQEQDVDSLKKLIDGSVDAALVTSAEEAERFLIEHSMSDTVSSHVLLNGFSLIYPIVSSNRTDLLKQINNGFDALNRSWLSDTESKWIRTPAFKYFDRITKVIRLTPKEQLFLSRAEPVKVIIPDDAYGPFYFRENGHLMGMDLDILNLLEARTGLKFQIVDGGSWTNSLELITTGEGDLITSIIQNKQRERTLSFSGPYYQLSDVIITRREESVRGLRDLREKLVAIPRNWNAAQALRRANPDVRLIYTRSIDEALTMVASGDAYAYVGNSMNATFAMDRGNHSNLKIATPVDLGQPPLKMAVYKGNAELLSIINKGLATISQAEMALIKNRWFKVQYDYGLDKEGLYRAIGFFGLVIAGIFLGIFIWNQRLRLEVRARLLAEEKLIAARVAAEAAADAKSNFLATMSHEIRTPLNGILGMVEVLLISRLNDKQRDQLRTIQMSGSSLLEILNDVLDFSKIDAGKLAIDRVPVNLEHLLLNVVKIMRPVASKRGLNIEFTNHIDNDCGYLIDSTRFKQVVLNLLGNAIKFTEAGSIYVTAGVHPGSNMMYVRVEDEGIGIPKEKLDQIFDPFEQAEQSTTRKFGGTGLGLSISRQLAQMMGGDLSLRNRDRVGTEAEFNFAAKTCELPQSKRTTNNLPVRFKPANILLVEDHLTNQRVALAQLAQLGLKADVANDGIEALGAIEQKDYELILSDCHMPNMDGYELVKAIRNIESSNPQMHKNTVIAVTANALDGERDRCIELGFDGFLPKPFGLSHLSEVLEQYLTPDESGEKIAALDAQVEELIRDSIHTGADQRRSHEDSSDQGDESDEPSVSSTQEVNFSDLKQLVADPIALSEVVVEFLSTCERDVNVVLKAKEGDDLALIQGAAHRIKGTAPMVGATALGEVAKQIDSAAKAGELDRCLASQAVLATTWNGFVVACETEFKRDFRNYKIGGE